MVRVCFKGYGETQVALGTTILEAAQQIGAPEGCACGGVCACSTCHVYISKGSGLLSDMEDEESEILDKAFDIRPSSRLGCQARVEKEGIIEVEISRESLDTYLHEHPQEREKWGKGKFSQQ
ncbi:2Fe-2S iron-sulfur cluster-binding protein [Pajaroellobacter abortibovis]|uniref:2Fe-2S ferredoxin n=1 Tax=Pajaroellobacter abortibovis TaxID=1882918 RepID=A0A1L6MWQ7_9BACT|nr:2Fe-2S iron-sulfur cluster-binding protein [Pajaroellobacter abortibovis]APR99847.1 2Fe-2S ferredoxin [Pajaroellobacter abortibovis]